jgi:hypothetical protein
LASGRVLRPRSLIHYSKPCDLLHGEAFQLATCLETLHATFLNSTKAFCRI